MHFRQRFTLIALLLTLAFFLSASLSACMAPDQDIQGTWIDESGLDIIAVKKLEGMEYTIGNNLSQLRLTRLKNELHGITALGDSVRMVFNGDSARYFIMGIETTYSRKSPHE